MNNGLGRQLYQNLLSGRKALRKETLWSISNIIANGPELIQMILDVKEMVERMFYMLENDEYSVNSPKEIFLKDFLRLNAKPCSVSLT